ncbi:MAG TPA: hypothetical protein VFT22_25475 [Kofleriaceae bacterium]|nr:hypothetical protein [Kofleriaceae bacterium]
MPATLPERPLGRDRPIAVCRDQRSLEALCTCLAGKVDRWADGLHAPARCEPLDRYRATGVQLLEVRSRPADAESTAGGVTFVLAAAQGSKWSPIDAIETAPELDLTVKPHASNDAAIDRFEIRPWADETLIWIESRHETDETAMGERTRTGEASTTVCRVSRTAPSGARSSASCYVSVPRAEWDYTEAIVSDAGCRIRKAVGFAHHLEAGVLTVRLSHGTDLAPVGRFRL